MSVFEIFSGAEGPSLVVDGAIIAGPKPCGGGKITIAFKTAEEYKPVSRCMFTIEDNIECTEGACDDVWIECSGCHAKFDYYSDEWLMYENYCPACGRRIVR